MSIKFAYWVPNVSGGLVVSKLAQRTDWTFDYNKALAQTAERVGFDYALSQARFFASYGAEKQLEALTLTSALAAVTDRIKLISAIHPGLWHPGVIEGGGDDRQHQRRPRRRERGQRLVQRRVHRLTASPGSTTTSAIA